MEVEREDQEISSTPPAACCSDQEPGDEPQQVQEGLRAETDVDLEPPAADAGATPPPPSMSPRTEPCWYCLRSLDSEPPAPQQVRSPRARTSAAGQVQDEPLLPSSGETVNYQTDPRPHFGVACSSHSPGRPLWGSEGPSWGQRSAGEAQQTEPCPHCHLGLNADTLRWHQVKCQVFDESKLHRK